MTTRSQPPTNEMRLLHRVSAALNAARDRATVLEVALGTMRDLFGYRHCSVFLLDAEQQQLELVAQRGEQSPRVHTRVRVGQGIVGAAAAKREIVRVNRSATPLDRGQGGTVSGHLAVPMLAQETLVGALYVETVSERLLRKDDELLVTIVANQAAVALQNAQLNEDLERRVRARTAELATANLKLREAQAELVQSGKMVALGQLAAGLAHETNTPLGAIRSSVQVIQRALERLREVPEIEVLAERAPRVHKVFGALGDANGVVQEASGRLFTIFDTLRSFARLDQSALQWANLHEGLESTLALLSYRLGDRISVTRDFAELPRVRCHASELNQVFSILLTNAIEAIPDTGTITVRTHATETSVTVEIADTGTGIAPEHLGRVFDPGFTTKGVKVGTGLSLAIAYRIVEHHQGRLELASQVGEGTTALVELPRGHGLEE